MKNIIAIFKEIIEFLIREIPSSFKPVLLSKDKYKEFKRKGYLILDDKLDESICNEIVKSFEQCVINESNIWQDDSKSDTRLFYAQKYCNSVEDIINDEVFNSLAEKFYGKKITQKFSLINKVVQKDNSLGSGGGWHRDSPTTHQLKVLIYLSDVDEGNGQFQYIQNSFRKLDVFKAILKYKWGSKYRYTENEIEGYVKHFNKKIINITGKKGTIVIVDTKGIHRGSPIKKGKRYAMFNYYYKNNIPNHFKKYDV